MKPLFAAACSVIRRRGGRTEGTALIEASLLLPLVMLLMLNAMNFGLYIYGSLAVDNAARAAAQYAIYNGISVGFTDPPAFTAVQSLVTADVTSLHNNGTVKERVCKNKNGTATCTTSAATCPQCGGTVTGTYTVPADNEPALYTLFYVDIEYTYTPFIGTFSIPALGIFLTPPTTLIHRQVAMRSMQ